jgi:hypothetical protein
MMNRLHLMKLKGNESLIEKQVSFLEGVKVRS